MSQRNASQEYFASLEDPIQLASEMQNKIRVWREWCAARGLTNLWGKKIKNYYGVGPGGNSSQAIVRGGSEGELSLIKVNDLHNLIQNQLVMVTSQRPAGQARAINSDTSSLKSSRIGTALAEYYMAEAGFETKFIQAVETALLCDEAFMDLFWDKEAGDPIAVDPDTGKPVMSGDAVIRTHSSWNVTRDPGIPVESQDWYIISFVGNRFDYANHYPRFKNQILQVGEDSLPELPLNYIPDGSDAIYAHLLIHDRTPAVPNGRYSLMIGSDIVLDSELPYEKFPVGRISPADVIDGATGYSAANDILAMEDVTDALHSVVTTNQVTFGAQCIVGPEGGNLKISDLAKGVRYFELPPNMIDMLKPLQLTRTAPEIFNYIGMLNQKKEQQVGVNSVVRGQPEGQLAGASGSALALIQSQAIAFNSGIQRSYFRLLSDMMTKLIGVLRTYADTPRIAKIVGKSKSSALKEFKYTGQDLNSISSIVYEMVNPVSQTIGGRMALGQDLIKAGMIKNPKQYLTLVYTGQMDVLTENDESDDMLLLEENEKLAEGEMIPDPVITEIHADHIKSHMSVISSIEAKRNPMIVQNTLDHVNKHIQQWMQASVMNPGILMATGQQPLMPPAPPPPLPGAPQGAGQLVGNGQNPSVKKASEIQEAQQPGLPNIAGTQNEPSIPGVTVQ